VAAVVYFLVLIPRWNAQEKAALDELQEMGLLVIVSSPGKAQTANFLGQEMTSDIMRLVGRLQHLENLILIRTGLDDDEFSPVARLGNLISLSMGRNQVTAKGLKLVEKLKNLQSLTVPFNPVGDDAMEAIGRLNGLKILDVSSTGITDHGLSHLAGLKLVENLDLSGNDITNAGIEHLAGMTRLGSIKLGDTKVTPDGINRLQAFLPNLRVDTSSIPQESKDLTSKEPEPVTPAAASEASNAPSEKTSPSSTNAPGQDE
jgi:hypothetical protein